MIPGNQITKRQRHYVHLNLTTDNTVYLDEFQDLGLALKKKKKSRALVY